MSDKNNNIDTIQPICNNSQTKLDDQVESDGYVPAAGIDVSIPCSTQSLKLLQDNSLDTEYSETKDAYEEDSVGNTLKELDESSPVEYLHLVDDDEFDFRRTDSQDSYSTDSLSFPDYDDFYSDTDSREPIDENEDIFLYGRGCYPFAPLEFETWEVPKDDPYREFYGYSPPEKALVLVKEDNQREGNINVCTANDTRTPEEKESLLLLPENQPPVVNFAQSSEVHNKGGEPDVLDESCRDKAISEIDHAQENDRNTKAVSLDKKVKVEEKEDEFKIQDNSVILAELVQPIDELHKSTAKLDSEPLTQKSPKKRMDKNERIEDGIHTPRTGVSISFEKKDTP